jgi:hypothetical protein
LNEIWFNLFVFFQVWDFDQEAEVAHHQGSTVPHQEGSAPPPGAGVPPPPGTGVPTTRKGVYTTPGSGGGRGIWFYREVGLNTQRYNRSI